MADETQNDEIPADVTVRPDQTLGDAERAAVLRDLVDAAPDTAVRVGGDMLRLPHDDAGDIAGVKGVEVVEGDLPSTRKRRKASDTKEA